MLSALLTLNLPRSSHYFFFFLPQLLFTLYLTTCFASSLSLLWWNINDLKHRLCFSATESACPDVCIQHLLLLCASLLVCSSVSSTFFDYISIPINLLRFRITLLNHAQFITSYVSRQWSIMGRGRRVVKNVRDDLRKYHRLKDNQSRTSINTLQGFKESESAACRGNSHVAGTLGVAVSRWWNSGTSQMDVKNWNATDEKMVTEHGPLCSLSQKRIYYHSTPSLHSFKSLFHL